MYKTPKTKFNYLGEKLTHSQIHNKLGKAKRCRKLRLHYKEAMVDYNGVPLTMIQHILLTLKYRFEHYETKGALFNQVREVIIESRLNERLWVLFIELIRLIEVLFDGIDEMELWEKILNDDRAYDMINRLLPNEPLIID